MRLALTSRSERLSRSINAAAASGASSLAAGLEVDDRIGESGTCSRSVDALEHRGEQFFDVVDVVVDDRSVEPAEVGRDQREARRRAAPVRGIRASRLRGRSRP
jgi:hypothetical protein